MGANVGDRFGALPSAAYVIDADGDRLPIKFACAAQESAGNTTVVAAVSGHKIRVLGWVVARAGAGSHHLASYDGGFGYTAITGKNAMTMTATEVVPLSPTGWCETAAGEALALRTEDAPASITLAYVEYPA